MAAAPATPVATPAAHATGSHRLPQTGLAPARPPLEAVVGFAAMLRDHGLAIGVAEVQAMVHTALALPLAGRAGSPCWSPERLSAAWRAVACHDPRAWRQWPDLFERYWFAHRTKGTVRASGQTRPRRDLRELVQDLHRSLDDAAARAPRRPEAAAMDTALAAAGLADADDSAPPRARGGASQTDPLHDRSFSEWLPQDLSELEQLAERITRRLRRRWLRRWHAAPAGRRLDLRRTLRHSLATGGEPIHPAWRQRRRERPRLFILVDVSRSMETHAQLFLRMARAFVQAAQARVFVFHTRLAEVTPLLQRDSAAVQERINAVTAGFGGGTRIATSIDDFVQVHARAQLGRRARVWVLSDGFDADEPHRLAEALARVRGRGASISWLHPSPEAPASQAMQQARGAVARFVRLNSLADLAAAATRLD